MTVCDKHLPASSSDSRTFTIPTKEFRNLSIPGYNGAKLGTCFAKVTDLPQGLGNFMRVNPRVPKRTKGVLTGPVPKAILDTLRESPEEMALKNIGIYILADSFEHAGENGGAGALSVTLTDSQRHGIVNSGHTFAAIREALETADDDERTGSLRQAFVRLHLLQGVPHDMAAEIAEGLNRSKQVQDPSLENLRGHFDEIKRVMDAHRGHDAIAYHEGADGDVYIADVLALIEMFNLDRYPKGQGPVRNLVSASRNG